MSNYFELTPQQRWIGRERPFHLTGEVSVKQLEKIIKPIDLPSLNRMILGIQESCLENRARASVLVVGSAASHAKYRDIDLLACVEPSNIRDIFQDLLRSKLDNLDFWTISRRRIGSHLFLSSEYTPCKLFATPYELKQNQTAPDFDITFMSENNTFRDELAYHARYHLAFCNITSMLPTGIINN